MESGDFNFLTIPEGADPWNYLPLDVACNAISRITDISDISKALQSSPTFERYAPCIQNLTTSKFITVPISFLTPLIYVKTADHKIMLIMNDINVLSSLNNLQQAHFVTNDVNVVPLILQNLNGLNSFQNNFKISLIFNDTIVGILIFNNNLLIIPLNNPNVQQVIQLISNTELNLIPVLLAEAGYQAQPAFTGFRLWKNPMREFLRVADFGLVDPTQPPSDQNGPLSELIVLVADGCNANLLQKICSVYVNYNQLFNGVRINSDQLMRKCFGEQMERNKPEVNLSAMLFAHFSSIIQLNSMLDPITVEEVAEYDFPVIPTLNDINDVTVAVNNAKNIYNNLKQQARHNPGVFFYATDGSIRHLS